MDFVICGIQNKIVLFEEPDDLMILLRINKKLHQVKLSLFKISK